MTTEYTKDELAKFTTLVEMTESLNNGVRIQGRLDLKKFVDAHGKDKCDAMFEEIKNL